MTTRISRKTGEIAPPRKVALMLGINLLTAVTVPIILHYTSKGTFSITEEIILGFLIAITFCLVELLFLTQHIYDTEINQTELWKHKHTIDGVISDIRSSMHTLIEDKHSEGFYFEHYKSELQLVQSRLQNTIARKEILLDRHHIEATHALLTLYDSPVHSIFRATHLLWETGDVFDVTYQVWFNAWLEKLRDKKVSEIRRVFVYRDESDFKSHNARKLLAFHNGTSLPLHAKIITRSDLHRFKADFNISDGVEDFGIFSNLYLYLGSARNLEQIAGTFSQDEARIRQYIHCFDSLWNTTAKPISDFVTDSINEKELFDRSYQFPKAGPDSLRSQRREEEGE